MRGRDIVRVGLLLPFSLRPQEATALYNAAELALFDHGNQNTLLIPRDAGSTEASANAEALRRASADEADSCSEQTNLATWFHLRKEPSSGRNP